MSVSPSRKILVEPVRALNRWEPHTEFLVIKVGQFSWIGSRTPVEISADQVVLCLGRQNHDMFKLVTFLSLRFISLFCSHYSHIWRNCLLYFPFHRATPWIKDEGAIGVCRAVEPSACIYAFPACMIQLITKTLSLKKNSFSLFPLFFPFIFHVLRNGATFSPCTHSVVSTVRPDFWLCPKVTFSVIISQFSFMHVVI